MCLCGVVDVACPPAARSLNRSYAVCENERGKFTPLAAHRDATHPLCVRFTHTRYPPSSLPPLSPRGDMYYCAIRALFSTLPARGKTGHNFIRLFAGRPRRTKKCNKSQSAADACERGCFLGSGLVHSHTRTHNPTDFVWKKDTAGILCLPFAPIVLIPRIRITPHGLGHDPGSTLQPTALHFSTRITNFETIRSFRHFHSRTPQIEQ